MYEHKDQGEEGVDYIAIESDVIERNGFKLYQTGYHDSNQLLRFVLRDRVSVSDFKFYVHKYDSNEPIRICVPRTRINKNTELLIIADKKYFPELNTIDDQLLLNACAIMYGCHVALSFGFENSISHEIKKFTFYICPYDIIYHDFTRSIFLSLAAQAFAKHRFGVTQYDKKTLLTAVYEKQTFHDLEKMNLAELDDQVNKGQKKIYAAFNDAITILPFMEQYEYFRTAILSPPLKEAEKFLTKDQLYNIRTKDLVNHLYYPYSVYESSLPMDLDYCPTCITLNDAGTKIVDGR